MKGVRSRPTGKGKNRKSAGKDEESAIITLVLSYRPAAARAASKVAIVVFPEDTESERASAQTAG